MTSARKVPQLLMILIIALLFSCLILIARWRRRSRQQGDMHLIPAAKMLPLLGSLPWLLRLDFHRVLLQWTNELGGIFRAALPGCSVGLVVTDPDLIHQICSRGSESYCDKSSVYSPINSMSSHHDEVSLLTSKSDATWAIVRKAISGTMSSSTIKGKFPIIQGSVSSLTRRIKLELDPLISVDIDQLALHITLDIILEVGFGVKSSSSLNTHHLPLAIRAPQTHLLRVLPRCFTEVMLRIANPIRSRLPPWVWDIFGQAKMPWAWGTAGSRSLDHFISHVKSILECMKQNKPQQEDQSIGAALFRLCYEAKAISEARLLSEMAIIFVEGFETTGHTLAFTVFHLASNPEHQNLCYEELLSLGIGVNGRSMQASDLSSLRYLGCCVKEAMRMHPVVSLMGRTTRSDRNTKIGPYSIPPNTHIALPLYSIHNSLHNWDEPHLYKPSRFQDLAPDSFTGPAFYPFSLGLRDCVGQSLAKMELFVVLATLISDFEISLDPSMLQGPGKGIKGEATMLTLQIAGGKGIQVKLRPR